MTREEFKTLVKGMKAVYAQPTFIPDQDAFNVWFELLKDIPYQQVNVAIQKYMLTEKFPPTIADIREKEIASNTIDAIVNFFSQLPGKIWTWLSNTLQKVIQWGSDMVAKGKQAASDLCSAVINGVANLPSQMASVGYNIVMGVWNGICNAAGWFRRQVQSFFSGIVDGVKGALGIHSPSKVFADEIGKWIPPGIGVGIEAEMPDLYQQMDDEMANLGKRMQTAVNVETGKIAVDKKVSTTYKVEKEKQGVFESGDTTVEITGETHVHVDLDGREVGDTTTPIVDENMARIDTHKKRGG